MEIERKILSNTLLLATGQLVAQLANFGFVVLLARSFGASTLGLYSLAMAIGALSGIFVSFGTNSLARKEIARDPRTDRDVIGKIFPLQILAGIAMLAILTTITLLLSEDRNAALVIIVIGSFHVIVRWHILFLSRFHSRQAMAFVAAVQAGTRLGILLIGALAVYTTQSAVLAVSGFPISVALLFMVAYFYGVHQFGWPRFSLDLSDALTTFRKAWPFMSILVLAVLYERLGVLVLRMFHSDTAVGYFASAERLLVPFNAVFAVLIAAVFPALMRFSPDNRDERDLLALRFLRLLLSLALPAATLVFLFSTDIIYLLYGTEFEEAILVMSVLAWAIALRGFNAFLSMLTISTDRQARLSFLKLISLVLFILLCILLIPRHSFLGLAYSIIAADFFLAFTMYWSLRPERVLTGLLDILWRPVLSCVITMVLTISLSGLALSSRFALSLATLVAAAFLTGAVRRHDFSYLLRIAGAPGSRDSD